MFLHHKPHVAHEAIGPTDQEGNANSPQNRAQPQARTDTQGKHNTGWLSGLKQQSYSHTALIAAWELKP